MLDERRIRALETIMASKFARTCLFEWIFSVDDPVATEENPLTTEEDFATTEGNPGTTQEIKSPFEGQVSSFLSSAVNPGGPRRLIEKKLLYLLFLRYFGDRVSNICGKNTFYSIMEKRGFSSVFNKGKCFYYLSLGSGNEAPEVDQFLAFITGKCRVLVPMEEKHLVPVEEKHLYNVYKRFTKDSSYSEECTEDLFYSILKKKGYEYIEGEEKNFFRLPLTPRGVDILNC